MITDHKRYNNTTSFNGWIYGKTSLKTIGPFWVCPLGETEFINLANKAFPKDVMSVSQNGELRDKNLSFEIQKHEFDKLKSLKMKLSPLLELNKKQKKVLDNPHIKSIVFKLSKEDFIFDQNYLKMIRLINNVRFHIFRTNLRKYFIQQNEREWLEDFFAPFNKN